MNNNSTVEEEPDQSGIGSRTLPQRVSNIEDVIQTILVVVVVSVGAGIVALVIGVGTLVLDQQHFNDEFYRQATGQKTITKTQTIIVKQPLIDK